MHGASTALLREVLLDERFSGLSIDMVPQTRDGEVRSGGLTQALSVSDMQYSTSLLLVPGTRDHHLRAFREATMCEHLTAILAKDQVAFADRLVCFLIVLIVRIVAFRILTVLLFIIRVTVRSLAHDERIFRSFVTSLAGIFEGGIQGVQFHRRAFRW